MILMASYFYPGIAISAATSIIAGLLVGSVMARAGFTSIWLFRVQMFSFLIGGALIFVTQVILTVMDGFSLGLRSALLLALLFVLSDPIIALVAAWTAIALNNLIRIFCSARP
jgi:hypothetical protein